MTSHRPAWLAYAPAVVIFAILASVLLSSGGLVVYRYFNDALVVMDAMWRASIGQTPHIDFPTPIGQAYYWPFAVLSRLGDVRATTLLQANVLVAAIVLLLATLSLPRRMSPLLYGLAVLTMVAVAMTPRDQDGGFDAYAFLAPYNTWGWALVALPGLVALLPGRTPATRRWIVLDGVVLGVALGLLLYLKVTFFLPAVAFVLIGLVLRHLPFPTAAVAAVTLAGMAIAVELMAHNNAAYLADLKLVAEVNVGGDEKVRLSKLVKSITLAAVGGSVLLAAIWSWAPSLRPGQWLGRHWRPIVVAAVLMGGGALIASQNHPKVQVTLIGIGALAAAELARRQSAGESTDPSSPAARPVMTAALAIGWLLLAGLVAPAPALDVASIIGHAFESHGDRTCRLPALRGVADDLLVKRLASYAGGRVVRPASCHWILAPSAEPYMRPGADVWEHRSVNTVQNLDAGMRLVSKHAGERDVILAAAFANPFPFLTKSRPPAGVPIWWDEGRNFSKARHPAAEYIVGSPTMIMQDLETIAGRNFWSIYGDAIAGAYAPVEETSRWGVWKRRGPLPIPAP